MKQLLDYFLFLARIKQNNQKNAAQRGGGGEGGGGVATPSNPPLDPPLLFPYLILDLTIKLILDFSLPQAYLRNCFGLHKNFQGFQIPNIFKISHLSRDASMTLLLYASLKRWVFKGAVSWEIFYGFVKTMTEVLGVPTGQQNNRWTTRKA